MKVQTEETRLPCIKQSPKGMSLIEVLVAMGLMSLLALAMANLFVAQGRQLRVLQQKQEVVDLKNVLLQYMTDPNVCTWQLKDNPLDVSMATSATSPSPTVVDLSELRSGPTAASALIAKKGQKLPGSQSSLQVKDVLFKDIYATGNPDEYRGTIEIQFDSNSAEMELRPVQMSMIVSTVPTDPANAKKISACVWGGARVCRLVYPPTVVKGPCGIAASVSCAADEEAVAGGATGGTNMAAQNAQPWFAGGKIKGWYVTWLDYGGPSPACTINEFANGTTRPGSSGCFTTSAGLMCGTASAVCCKL